MKEEKIIVALKYPIPIKMSDGKEVMLNEIKIGRLKAKHFKLLPQDILDKDAKTLAFHPKDLLPIIAGLCDLSEKVVDEMDFEDLVGLTPILGKILGKPITQMAS